MDALMRVSNTFKSLRETRLTAIRSPAEFFDYQRISRPADLNQATQRISYNTRYFSGKLTWNYGAVIAVLAVYAVLTNPLLLISLGFLVGGFMAINKWAPDPVQFGDHVVTQKHLYTALFVIGLPMLWLASPIMTFFWLVGASAVLILGHASVMEPGIESEYASVQDQV
ncbi:prenylated rab acceptor PRA1 [Fistulina hepatica ATCC 64428]|uniref:PRA1 family protein n=1 Tax=Fistulina hepatica ATCC 64428 TaxID=1128425 RepID=A0A0D7A3J5_9AGAR|nr:prenylated rab acceptor PRA1 [Fistulina hepatica ATCC 64428]